MIPLGLILVFIVFVVTLTTTMNYSRVSASLFVPVVLYSHLYWRCDVVKICCGPAMQAHFDKLKPVCIICYFITVS